MKEIEDLQLQYLITETVVVMTVEIGNNNKTRIEINNHPKCSKTDLLAIWDQVDKEDKCLLGAHLKIDHLVTCLLEDRDKECHHKTDLLETCHLIRII